MPPLAPNDLDDLVVSPDATLLETMQVIDASGLEVALVCDASHTLMAVVTDGDIRRALIRGMPMTAQVKDIGNKRFLSVAPDTSRAEVMHLLLEKSIKSLPVVDEDGKLVDLHTLHTVLRGSRCESWAVVMAGGKGERLGELTKAIPKPMLPIGDRPILQHIVEHLVTHGIRRIFLSVNYLGRMIEDHFEDGSRFFCRIEYLREDKPLGTGGPLALLPEAPKSPLVVMNGDLLTRVNLSRMLAFHRAGEFKSTMAVRQHLVQVPFGVAEIASGRVKKLVEKPSLKYHINAGIYVFDPEIVARVDGNRLFPITELFDGCLSRKEAVGAYHMQEPWSDIGLPEQFQRAQIAT